MSAIYSPGNAVYNPAGIVGYNPAYSFTTTEIQYCIDIISGAEYYVENSYPSNDCVDGVDPGFTCGGSTVGAKVFVCSPGQPGTEIYSDSNISGYNAPVIVGYNPAPPPPPPSPGTAIYSPGNAISGGNNQNFNQNFQNVSPGNQAFSPGPQVYNSPSEFYVPGNAPVNSTCSSFSYNPPGIPSCATYNSPTPASGPVITGYNAVFAEGYNPGTISSYNGPQETGTFNSGGGIVGYSGNFQADYFGNNANYNTGILAYTGNFIAAYSGNFTASYNPGSASAYNPPIPGTPGNSGFAFGLYFPGGNVCAPATFQPEQEISYYFEGQEIDYRSHAIQVPPGGEIVVRIE